VIKKIYILIGIIGLVGILYVVNQEKHLVWSFAGHPTEATVVGRSMYPVFSPGDTVRIDRSYDTIRENDVVAFYAPDTNALTVKRVRGVPGDVVWFEDWVIKVNDFVIAEGDIGSSPAFERNVAYTIQDDRFFAIGDNIAGSTDSRHYGFVPYDRIEGVVNK